MKTTHFLTAMMAAALLCSGAASANVISNGGFEAPVIPSASFLDITQGHEPAGFVWTVTVNGVDIFSNGVGGTTGTVFEGNQALDLVGFGSTGGIAQSFATTPGQQYSLTFEYANNPISTVTASAAVTVTDGLNTLLTNTVTHTTSTDSNFAWTLFTEDFTATGASATLGFTETVGSNNGGVFLDAISVDPVNSPPVPEPATLALFGSALIGLGLIRRRQAS